MQTSSREKAFLRAFFFAALAWHGAMASVGWRHAISDIHGWRQAQTAITAYFIQQGGPWIAYETPVLGPPWRIPHELPRLPARRGHRRRCVGPHAGSRRPCDFAGILLFALGVAFLLLGELGVCPWNRLLVLGFWLLSPHYIFWSRTFMVESTALFLCSLFLLLAGRFLSRARPVYAIGAVASGALGAAVKPITVVPFVLLASVWWLLTLRKHPQRLGIRMAGALVVVLPLVGGWLWQRHADSLKGLDFNPLAWGIASSQLFRDWILGPVGAWAGPDVRLKWENWQALLSSRVPETLGHPAVAVASLGGILVARRRRAVYALLVTAAFVHLALFMPLHLAHPYYMYAIGGFLITAVGLAAVALRECDDWRRHLAWALAGLLAVSGVSTYSSGLYLEQLGNAYRRPAWFVRLAREISARTEPNDVIVVFGMNWNPELPYYARRRALMWPAWGDRSPASKDVARSIANLAGYRIGAVVSCSRTMGDATLAQFRALGGIGAEAPWRMSAPTSEDHGEGQCTVYFRRVS